MSFLSDFLNMMNNNNSEASANPSPSAFNNVDAYFDSLITEENFPGYEIERNVHAKVFDQSAHKCCLPITYLFSRNGKPVLAILLMNTNQYRSMIARGTYKVLNDGNIKFLRFFRGYDNDRAYVINRIKENLF